MLATFNKENQKNAINRKNSFNGRPHQKNDDEIEKALALRASRGELKVPKNVKFESNQEMADKANGKEEQKKPSKPPVAAKPPKVAAPQKQHEAGKVPKYLEKYKEEAKQK